MQSSGIPVPNHIVVDRDKLPEGQDDPEGFMETEDYVELDGSFIILSFSYQLHARLSTNIHRHKTSFLHPKIGAL